MLQQLRATKERFARSFARVLRATGAQGDVVFAGLFGFAGVSASANQATAIATVAPTTTVWNAKPCVPSTALRMHGKYNPRRLQEMLP